MSKAIRIREHLYAEIEALAKQERRSLISQLEILLEQALRLEAGGFERIMDGDKVVGVVIPDPPAKMPVVEAVAERPFKPDFK